MEKNEYMIVTQNFFFTRNKNTFFKRMNQAVVSKTALETAL